MTTQAVILAGGIGTRLWPLTKTIPKPMTAVAGRPYLEWQIEELARQEIRDIVLLTGYMGEQIEDHFGDGSHCGLRIRYSREAQPMGTGGALRHARGLLAPEFLLIYGDSFLPIDYHEPLRTLIAAGPDALAVIVVVDNRATPCGVPGNIEICEDDVVLDYEKDSPKHPPFVDAGVLALRAGLADWIPAEAPVVSLEREVFPALIRNGRMRAFVTEQRFYDIGTPERLKVIEEVFAKQP